MNFDAIYAQSHAWEVRESLQDYLAQQLLRGRIALILGAGVSVPFGLPNWDTLIARMFDHFGEKPPAGMGASKAAEVLLARHCRDDPRHYRQVIRKALYAGTIPLDFWAKTPVLTAIGSLVMASHRGSASTVITLNFDDILEMYLEFHGFVASSIASDQHWADNADVRIFHPHGVLPYRDDSGESDSQHLVLDENSFSSALSATEGRLWRERVLTLMRSRTCLFIGIGGSDPNLASFLHDCSRTHVSSTEQLAYWGVRYTHGATEDDKLLWSRRGVHTVGVDDYETDLPQLLLGICQRAAMIRAQELRV